MDMSIKGILFDKDDTIIEMAPYWKRPVELAAGLLAEEYHFGENVRLKEWMVREAGYDGESLLPESPLVKGTNEDVARAWKFCLEEFCIRIDPDFPGRAEKLLEDLVCTEGRVVPKRGIPELIPRLKKRGLFLGIVTSDCRRSLEHCLRELGIREYFDYTGTADGIYPPKPAPDMLWAFARFCSVRPEEVLMVGDSANDMLFAKNAGAEGVFFSSGERKLQLPEGARFRISEAEELEAILKKY